MVQRGGHPRQIHQQAMVTALEAGAIDIARTPALPDSSGSRAIRAGRRRSIHYAYDLDKARSLLTASGVSNLEFDYVVVANAETTGFGQIIQADYQKLAQHGVYQRQRLQSAAQQLWLYE